MKKVFVSAGHGGTDPGAVAGGFREKDLNLVIAAACAGELRRHGVEVRMNRTEDIATTAAQDAAACNSFGPDAAVDIHCNAGGGNGAEVYHHFGGGTGKALAGNILEAIRELGQNSRGAKVKKNGQGRDYFFFIREIAAPSVIVECAFLDHGEDIRILSTREKQEAMGKAIAKGILQTLGIPWQEELPQVPEESGSLLLPAVGKGDHGETVRALQLLLMGRGYSCGSYGADGEFGAATQAAVRAYQGAKGLGTDGLAGSATWRALLGL